MTGLELPRACARILAVTIFFLCLLPSVVFAQSGGMAGIAGQSQKGDSGSGGTGGTGAPAPLANAPPRVDKVALAFKLQPTEATRGAVITLTGQGLPVDKDNTRIWLDDFDIGAPAASDGLTLQFIIPGDGTLDNERRPLSARRYVLSISEGTDADARRIAIGVLRVVPEKLPPLKVTGVSPTIVYPRDEERSKAKGETPATKPSLTISGDGFGGRLTDYALLVDGTEFALCSIEGAPTCQGTNKQESDACCKGVSAAFTSDHQLYLYGDLSTTFASRDQIDGHKLSGDHTIALRAGDLTTASQKVAFSPYSASIIRYLAIGLTTVLLGLMVALVALGGRKHRVGTREFIGNAFLIDTETDTYSLSKLQFYAWSTAALLAYSYLSLSRCLVQGELNIADIPRNLPTIWGLSAFTAVASVGITKMRGSKASGEVHPSFADLLSTGGVVSPERFQFFLWTVVAIGTFLLNVWNVDPMVLDDLPQLPDGLLAISGVSSVAYLGGKFARGAGPVIDQVLKAQPPSAPLQPPGPVLLVQGTNLSVDASFEIKGVSITELLDPALHPDGFPIIVRRSPRDPEKFALALKLALLKTPPAWAEILQQQPEDPSNQATLTIVNSDGQRSDAQVPRAAYKGVE